MKAVKRYPSAEHLIALKKLLYATKERILMIPTFTKAIGSRRERLRRAKMNLADIYKTD